MHLKQEQHTDESPETEGGLGTAEVAQENADMKNVLDRAIQSAMNKMQDYGQQLKNE